MIKSQSINNHVLCSGRTLPCARGLSECLKWMKQEGARSAKHGGDMRVLYETDYDLPRYIHVDTAQ